MCTHFWSGQPVCNLKHGWLKSRSMFQEDLSYFSRSLSLSFSPDNGIGGQNTMTRNISSGLSVNVQMICLQYDHSHWQTMEEEEEQIKGRESCRSTFLHFISREVLFQAPFWNWYHWTPMGHGIRVDFNEEKGFLTNTDEIKDISTSCGRTQVIDWHRGGRWWWCRYNNWNNLRQQLILNFISIGRSVRI